MVILALFFTEPMWCCAEPDVVLDGLLSRLNQEKQPFIRVRTPFKHHMTWCLLEAVGLNKSKANEPSFYEW